MSSVPVLPPNFNAFPPPTFGFGLLANEDSTGVDEKSDEIAGVLYDCAELMLEP
jgi:hypothetical protein